MKKKAFSALFLAVLLALSSFVTVSAETADAEVTCTGDINGDGELTVADSLAVMKHIAGRKDYSAAYDYNSDGKVSLVDLLRVFKKLVAQTPVYPVFYVDPGAAADGDGTEAAPFSTVAEAYAATKSAYAKSDYVYATIKLSDGVHRVSEALRLESSSAIDCSLTITGSEKAVLSGNTEITASFSAVEGENYYVAQLPAKEDGSYPLFRTLYVDGELAELAYTGYNRYADAVAAGTVPTPTGAVDIEADKIYVDASIFDGYSVDAFAGSEIHLPVEWEYKIMEVKSVDLADTDADGKAAVYLDLDLSPTVIYGDNDPEWENRYCWFANSLAFLDTPGEYYYDSNAGKIYYMPKAGTDIADSTFEYPAVQHVMIFKNVDNITLDGFTVTGCDNIWIETATVYGEGVKAYGGNQAGHTAAGIHNQSALHVVNTDTFTVKDVNFTNVAGDGIQMRGMLDNVTVDGCSFTNIGATAVRLGNMVDWSESDYIKNAAITNNYIDNAAWYLRNNCAIYVRAAKDTEITNNTIKNCSYTGIHVGSSWVSTENDPQTADWCNLYNVEIAYNHIENFMTDMADGGAVYTLGGNANTETYANKYFNTMHDNYVVVEETTGTVNGRFMPLYHDSASSNWHSYNNVVATCEENIGLGAFYIQVAGEDDDPDALTSSQSNNILAENNYFLYAEWKAIESIGGETVISVSEEDYIAKVIFRGHALSDYNVIQQNNSLVPTDADINEECAAIIANAGNK